MTSDDISTVAAWMVATPLWQRYRMDEAKAQQQFETALARADLLLVADRGADQACGVAWCLPAGGFGRSAYLRAIGVHPAQTGSGVGSALLAAVEQQAAAFTDDLFLLVSDFNEAARRFYRRHGYVQVGAIPGYVLPDVTELLFRKRLRGQSPP